MKAISIFFALLLLLAFGAAQAADTPSGLPLPRFASLRGNEVNMRAGPGTRYPIDWVYTHPVPVEITAEYDVWRRVRDPEGSEGWVHKTELSGKRMALVTGAARDLRGDDKDAAPVVAHLEVGAIGQILACARDWCRMKFEDTKGYMRKTEFWGAYPGEIFD
jgi:SH3-like domain-containing protein